MHTFEPKTHTSCLMMGLAVEMFNFETPRKLTIIVNERWDLGECDFVLIVMCCRYENKNIERTYNK